MAGRYLFEDLLAQAGGPGVLSVSLSAESQALLLAQVGPLAVLGALLLGRQEQLLLDIQRNGLRCGQLLLLQKLQHTTEQGNNVMIRKEGESISGKSSNNRGRTKRESETL